MPIFYLLAVVVAFLGVLSLRGGFSFKSHTQCELSNSQTSYCPFASVIAPCRGLEEGLEQNLLAIVRQDYPVYEVIFVVDHASDPARSVIEQVIESVAQTANVSVRLIVAGSAIDSGQKVHNLRRAVPEVDSRSEVVVFVDSDARPHAHWLKALVAPLTDETVGAASGYRWFVPAKGGFASYLRAVWNASIASALGPNTNSNFCWGGSTAIRRSTFEKLKVLERWRGTVSDDFTLTRTLQENKMPIVFVPSCLVPALDRCNLRQLFEFTNRQLKITRVYAPHLWRPVLIGSLLFCLAFFGGIALMIARLLAGNDARLVAISLLVIFLLGAAKAWIRFRAVARVIQTPSGVTWKEMAAHVFLWPITSALYLWNAVVAWASRRIEWRGITYELKSATEAVIIRRQSND